MRAVVFLAPDFLAAGLRAVDFFAVTRFAAGLRAEVFFAEVFLAVGFLRPATLAAFTLIASAASSALSTATSSSESTTAPITFWAVSVASTFLPASFTGSVIFRTFGMVVPFCCPASGLTRAAPMQPSCRDCAERRTGTKARSR